MPDSAPNELAAAEQLAHRAHAGQTRRNGEPYIVHPARVAARFPEQPELQPVAWLHDVLEDSATTPADLEHEGISSRVVALSLEADEAYPEFIRRASSGSRDAMAAANLNPSSSFDSGNPRA